ncbi:hypothetical protein K3495_g13296 [Podosphaera aphanis]|nr:hypothetical protein K3495_g13296 [Podosphaera aphanis]
MNMEELISQHIEGLEQWILREIEAKSIIVSRLNPTNCPQSVENMTAKQLYDNIADTRQETATAPYIAALELFLQVRFESTADSYIDSFLSTLQSVNNAADSFIPNNAEPSENAHVIGKGLASALFVIGTSHVDCLGDSDYAIRSSWLNAPVYTVHIRLFIDPAHPQCRYSQHYLDPEAYCTNCRHRHRNRECFIQHPELRKKGGKRKKNKGKGAAIATDIDSEDEVGVTIASARINEIPTIYDTGASHHFISQKKLFSDLKPCPKPFRFDQAIGAASLLEKGNAQLKFGSTILHLHDALYSPNSSCNIVSAGRLERLSNLFPDFNKSLLILKRSGNPNRPVANLVRKNDVFYIHPLNLKQKTNLSTTIAAPSIARIPVADAQRWHQRLGHIGQNILKKTAECSKGLEGISTNDLTTCETCHLSKAQRYVSREPRMIPNEPLDEIFIDTVGKITAAANGQQYAVIITDAKTRMRWVLTTNTKDQIAPLLIQWIESQHHQYGKRVRAIFRDGGSEFFRIKAYCDHHGIRTEISAPDTPEQNGVSESSNKVILSKARSMLIDAGMPASFWPWAIQHACFITNRLYCLRTKKVPLTDFLQGLNQPHVDQIDLSNLPRFGCRAYKLISPKPGKFESRATKGWFLGFQQTSKNFIIYHPQQTPSQRLKWITSFTPHVTFNEDVMFGDEPSNRQQPSNDCINSLPIFIVPTTPTIPPLTRNSQTATQFEGENQASSPESIITESSSSEDMTTEPPPSENMNQAPSSESIITESPSSEDTPTEPPPSEESPIFQDLTGRTSLQHTEAHYPLESIATVDDMPIYSESPTPSPPTQKTPLKLTYPSSIYEQTRPSLIDFTPLQSDTNDQQEFGPENDILDTISIHQKTEPRRQQNPQETALDTIEDPLDFVMTGWQPIPQIAGQKRSHSPEPEMMETRHGRKVKKHDYNLLHHGRSAHVSSDPTTWEEAMTCT